MRMLTISRATIRQAVKRAQPIIDAWERKYPKARDWQAECCEIAMIPAVACRLVELNRPGMYGKPNPKYPTIPVCYGFLRYYDPGGLPGYILPGWNGEPRPGYEASHAPGTAWNGVSRNLCGAILVEQLRMTVYEHEPLPEVMERAKIRLK